MGRYESSIDRQIREAEARGEFANLPGAGKPLPDRGQPLTENWWVDQYVAREKIGSDALPTTLRLRREVAELAARLDEESDEAVARELVSDLNRRIVDALRGTVDGPPLPIGIVDETAELTAWRRRRAS